ncbi:hypothetical protein HDU77_010815 [Chytriomyces hyalinus]|nr:hypothetical protein HDU77_010815 [Chytriomyces hyalinus]
MSKKGFSSPLFGKRKGSAAPSISEDQESKRLAKKADEKTADRLDVLRNHHSRVASFTSHTSRESATSNASSSLPPLAVSARADISTMTAEKIKCATYLESRKLNSLQAAVHSGDLRKLRALVAEKGRDVNKLDTYHGFTALHLAVDENKYDAAVILMDSSVALADKNPLKVIDLNAVNREGRTALVIAVIRGFSDIVHLLVKRSASLHVQDVLGCTALHYAVCLGDVSAFKLLTDAGAKTDVVDKSGIPLFFHAIKNKRTPIAENLLGKISTADINQAYGTDKSTALHFAVQHSMISIVHALIEKGANPVALDAEKRKPVERIDYTDYDEELVDFLTLTEMSMFGSVTSFVEGKGAEAKSVLEIISKSVASLVSPKGSQSQLIRSEDPAESEPAKVEMAAPDGVQLSEQEQISSSFSVSHKDKNDENTSPMLSYHDDELSVSDYGNDQVSAEVHIVVPSAETPDTEKQEDLVPDTNQLAPKEMDLDSVSVGPSVLSSSDSQSSSRRVSDKVEAFETKDESDSSSQSASEPYASEIALSDDDSDELMILPADDAAFPQTNIQTAIEEAICETEEFITAMFEAPDPPRIQVQLHEEVNQNQAVDIEQKELAGERVHETRETDISPSSTAVSTEQNNADIKDAVAQTWPIDASKSDACIETLQTELIDKNATIASLQQQIQSDAAAFQSRLDSLLAEQCKTDAEQKTNLDRTHVEFTESKSQLQQSQKHAQDSTDNWQIRYANLETDLSQEQSHNSVLEFEMNDMFAKSKVIEKHAADHEQLLKTRDDKIAAMDLQNDRFIEQIALLQCEVVFLTDKLGATEKALENETESRHILESKLEEGQVKNAEIIEELTAAVDEVESLQKKVCDLESKVSQLEQETQTAQTSHLENVHSQEQNERGFLSVQSRLQQEVEAKEKLQRSNLKLETELSAMKTELAINKAIINSRDSQIESFRESLKDTSAHHAAQAMSDRCSEVMSAEQSVKRSTDDSIAKYYEAEISALNQRLNDEVAFRTAQKSESLQIMTTITSLEDSLADIQSKYEEQSQKLSITESIKNEALDDIQELRFSIEDLKSSHENQLKKREDLIQEHLKTIHSLEKAAQDLKSQLAVIQKEKADIKKLRDESLAEFREKLSQLQKELFEMQQKNVVEVESLRTNHLAAISHVEDMLAASKKETAKAKQSLEAANEDAVQLQTAVDAKNDYISKLEETVAQLESSNDSLRSLNQSSEQNQESLVEEIVTLKLQHEQFISNLKKELNESVGKYQTVKDKFETEKRNAESLQNTVVDLEAEVARQRASMDSTDETLEHLHDQRETMERRIRYLEETSTDLESKKESLEQEAIELKTQHSNLRAAHTEVNAAKETLKLELDNLQGELNDCKFKLSESEDRVNVLSNDIKSMTNNVDTQIMQLKSQRDEANSELSSLKREYEKTRSDLSIAVLKIDHLATELSDSQICNEQILEINNELKQTSSPLAAENQTLQNAIEDFQIRFERLESSLSQEVTKKNQLQSELDAATKNHSTCQEDIGKLILEVAGMAKTLDLQFMQQKSQTDRIYADAISLENLKVELNNTQDNLADALEKISILEAKLNEKSLQLSQLDTEASSESERYLEMKQKYEMSLSSESDTKNQLQALERRVLSDNAAAEAQKASLRDKLLELKSQLENASIEYASRCDILQSSLSRETNENSCLKAELDSLKGNFEDLKRTLHESQSRELDLQQQLQVLRNAKTQYSKTSNNDKPSVSEEVQDLKLQLGAARAEIEQLELRISKISTAFGEVCVENGHLKKETSNALGTMSAALKTEQKPRSENAEYDEVTQVRIHIEKLMDVSEKGEPIRQLGNVTEQQLEQSMGTLTDQSILSIQNNSQQAAEAWNSRLELLEMKVNRYESERAILMAQQDEYQQEIAQLENDMCESEREFDAMILEKSELETTVAQQETAIAQYVHEKEDLTHQIFKLTSELEEAHKSMQIDAQAASRLQKQHSEELESSNSVLSAEVANKHETSVLTAQLSRNDESEGFEAKLNSLKLENGQLSDKVAALLEKCGKLESEKDSLERDLMDLKYTIDSLTETEQDLREEAAQLKSKESLQLERINTLELGVQKAEKENQRLENCLEISRMELQASLEKLQESKQSILELAAEKDALTTLTKNNSVAIKDLESLSVYHQTELEKMTSALKAETRKASKFEQISQQLSSLAHLPESSQRNDRNSASSQIESTETLAEEVVHTASKKSHKAYSSKDGNVSAALRDLHLLMNQEVRAVVMKLTTLEDNINTDTVKMSTLIDEVNADQQVESDVKNIFSNVFGTQCERNIEAKSVLSSATKKTQSTLSLFEQDFVAIIADLEAKETRQKNEIADLESRCAEFQAQIQELKLNAHESEGKIKDSKMYIKKLEATAADLESSLIETESQLSKSDRSHKLSFEREKAAREHFERAFESLQNDYENLKSQRVRDKAAQQSLQAEVFELGNTLDSAQKDLGTCRTENCRLNVLISSMKGQMLELENEGSQKSSDLENLKQQLFISAGLSSKSEEKSKQLQREVEQMKESLGALETVQLEQLQMISTLKDQVFEGQEMLRLKDAECKEVRLDLAKTDFKVKNLEDQKEEMQNSLASSTRKVSQLQENLKTKIMAAESLSLKLEETEELLSKSQKDIAEQGATILKMSQRVTEITACIKEREELLGKLQSKIIVVESNQSNSDLEVRLLSQELESNAGLKESILARNKEIQHMQTQVQSYASKEVNLTHSEAANELLRNEVLALKKALGAHGAIENAKIISNASYPLQVSQTNENIETLHKESNNLKNLLASKDTQIRHMESEMRSCKAEASEANGKSLSLEQSIERLNAQVIELKGMLKTKDQAVTQLKLKDLKQQEVINQFEYEKLDLQGQLELLRAQVSHYTEAIETKWQPQHGSFQKRLNELSNSLQEANMRNSFLQNEISQLKNLQATPGRAVPNAPASLTDQKESQKIFESLASLKLELGQLRTTLNNNTESSNDILQHEGLQRILESFKSALHTLSSKIHDAELKNRVPASLNHSNDEESTRFKAVKAELISEIEALESKLRQSRRDHASAEDRVLLLEDKLQTSKNCTEQAQIDLQEAQHQLRLAASEIRGLKADRDFESIDPSTVNALKADNVKLQDSLNSLKFQAEREVLSLMREVSEHESQISKLKEDLSQSSALTQRYEYHIQNLQWTLKIQTEAHEETKASLSHESQTARRLKLGMEEMQKKSTTETAPDLTQGNTYQVVSTPKNVLEADAHRQQIKFWKKKVQKLQAQVEAANELYDSKLDAICSKLEQSAIQWHQAELSLVQAVDHTARDDRIRLLKTDLKSIIRSINA